MRALKDGWMVFSEYCKLNNISQAGYHLKLLAKLDEKYKVNITPNARKTYAINVVEADKIFLKNKEV